MIMQDVSAVTQARHSTDQSTTIALCIPTWRRNDLLRQCLSAVSTLQLPDRHHLLVLVVDNDALGGAHTLCRELAQNKGLRLSYFIEPERGLCSVRNRLLQESLRTDAQWLAFLDDDEQPAPDWLLAHLHGLSACGADVSAGPVIQYLDNESPVTPQISDNVSAPQIPRFVACNNVMFRRKLISEQGLRFDPLFNFTGGEDFDFFESSRRCGNRHIWTGAAMVYETVTPERATFGYLFHRHWTGAMTRVMQQRKWRGTTMLWPRFLLKSLGKFLSGTVCLPLVLLPPHRRALEDCVKRYASAWGYVCGLLNLSRERYR